MIPPGARILLLIVNLALGILPSAAFFVWVERNASLPWAALEWGWPWIGPQTWSVPALSAWNFALILGFGVLHSLFAQPSAHRLLERAVPPQATRTLYMAVTGLSLVAVMGLWQSTGVVLWALPIGAKANALLSLALFWGFMLGSLRVMSLFDPLDFLGLRQIYKSRAQLTRTEGTPRLLTRGIYGRVRHPIYAFTLLAFAVAPLMTLDRAIVVAASALYLVFAIPIEERKLIRVFGPAYEDYRRRVSAVVPLRSREGCRDPRP